MKILHFGRFYNENFGGIERHVSELLKELARSVDVANIVSNDHWQQDKLLVDEYPVYREPSLGKFAGTALSPTMPFMARNLCVDEGYDIAHLHFPDPMAHLSFYALPKRTKLVISWHSDIIRQRNLYIGYRPFLEHILRRADAIVAATPKHFTSSTQIPADIPADRKHVIPYGIDFSRLDNPASQEQAIDIRKKHAGKKLVFAVGRHVYYKGFEYLIKSMQFIPDAVLLLGGNGPLRPQLEELVRELGLNEKVEFLGRVSEELLPAYYYAADIFCMPSIEPSEAFGLVQAEAMACGKPVICCELNNGVTYVNQHGVTGLVVPPRNYKSLAEALNSLLQDDNKCTQLGMAARQRVRSEFTVQNMTNGMLALYQKILAEDAKSA